MRLTKPIISIVGTTGVGKSQFSIELAKSINGEIINADSMQVYKKLDVITNKHPINERQNIPHHVINHVNWDEEYFIHRFHQEATLAINDIHQRGKVPIIIGGTHYYLQRLLFKNKTINDNKVRELTQRQLDILDGPVEGIFAELVKYDSKIAEKFHPKDKRKLRRALEIWYTVGQQPSTLYKEQKLDELNDLSLIYKTIMFWVYSDYDILSQRLDSRVDDMVTNGALQEVKELYEFYKQSQEPDITKGVYQVIGFKEFLPYLSDNGKLQDSIDKMKIRTKQYARYQIKWIKKSLMVELLKEAKFNYKNGGKVYMLNASDLQQWTKEVEERGIAIAQQFLVKGPQIPDLQIPTSLDPAIFPSSESLASFNSNKRLDSERNWKHIECDICTDSSGKPLVTVGEDNWKIHMNSRRHKRTLLRRQKQKEINKWLLLKSKVVSDTLTHFDQLEK